MHLDPQGSFEGRVALVTGAGRGIGEAVARDCAARGAMVAVADIDRDAATTVSMSLSSAMALQLDVRSKASFEQALETILARWGRLDIVVNNAGRGSQTPTPQITEADFDEIVAVNMKSVFFSCQVFSAHMRRSGYGRIVNITSLAGQNGGTVAAPHYAAAKAGAIMLTKYFARDLASSGVTVNAVSPGPVESAKSRVSAEQQVRIAAQIPIGRFAEVSEISAAVMLLAGDRGGAFVGATLDVNGGLYIR